MKVSKIIMVFLFGIMTSVVHGQQINIDDLVKMRLMEKTSLDNYLKSKFNSTYVGYEEQSHIWSITSTSDNVLENIVMKLQLSYESDDKKIIELVTGNKSTINAIDKQIIGYKMKKISSKESSISNDITLTEIFEGKHYVILIKKFRTDTGELMEQIQLTKKGWIKEVLGL
jgi:hypothetical protein